MLKLLIAIDGSDAAQHALQAAARLASQTAVQALLVNVRDSPGYHGEWPPFDQESLERSLCQRQDGVLEAAIASARSIGMTNVRGLALAGAPAQEIARAATEERVDHIVMGTRGMNALGGLLLGSVAQRVVHLAKVPVVLVK